MKKSTPPDNSYVCVGLESSITTGKELETKTWAVILYAERKRGGVALQVIFVKAINREKAHTIGYKACKLVFPEPVGFTSHVAIVRDTQIMYEELAFMEGDAR